MEIQRNTKHAKMDGCSLTMSTTPQNGTLQADVLSKIICTQPSNPPPSTTDPNASKRVCFYKSDDPQFSAKQIIISSRTFRTFDALLDALSKKVPLTFGEMGICDSMTGRMERDHFIMPSENDIEKSFHVNQDGSMTIEMKVHLHVNQEEMIGWTTTLSRACVNSQQRAVCSQPVSGYDSQGYDYDAVMIMRDVIFSTGNEDRVSDWSSYPEALQLKKRWRDFQDKNDIERYVRQSPRHSEKEFGLEVGSEGENQANEDHFLLKEPDSGEEHRDKCKDAYEDIQPHHPEASLEDCESDSEAQAHHPEPSLEDYAEYERRQALQTLDEESLIEKTSSPGTEDEEANEHVKELHISLDNDQDVDGHHAHRVDLETADSIRRELYNTIQSQETEKYKAQTEYRMAAASGDHGCNCVHPIVIPQELLDFVSLALLSSALTFTYDSNGHLRIEPHRCKLREMSLAIRNVDHQNVQRCLPTPNTSDLSDYRPKTSDSGGDLSQVSTDLLTESGEEEAERLWIYQSNMTRGPEEFRSCTKALDNGSVKPHPATDIKITASPRLNSINSLASIDDSVSHTTVQELTYIKSSGSFETDYPVQNLASHAVGNSSAGILIDKGRWLLKENHLIRKSPPDPLGMYENADTTSTDTGQENTTEEASYPSYESQHPPLAVISSSELEEMTKPHTPKCTYFNMLHSSDSDHFLDNQSVSSNKGGDRIRKSWELKVSPMGESSQMLAKKSGSLPSFASVDFKLADGKVHPEFGVSGAVEKSPRSGILPLSLKKSSGESTSLKVGVEEERAQRKWIPRMQPAKREAMTKEDSKGTDKLSLWLCSVICADHTTTAKNDQPSKYAGRERDSGMWLFRWDQTPVVSIRTESTASQRRPSQRKQIPGIAGTRASRYSWKKQDPIYYDYIEIPESPHQFLWLSRKPPCHFLLPVQRTPSSLIQFRFPVKDTTQPDPVPVPGEGHHPA
ncbi:hypothetical protein P4O66_000878 [Electrophorus voltai]|uniref:Doublecortin domain-containing protein n=1 Tax=Electrophorus voltai TaxID=2609070 RepID=A0AAD8ZE83_9TELE|nr:hypothetical protein P4O66_000878 [Electrophorus voltai]